MKKRKNSSGHMRISKDKKGTIRVETFGDMFGGASGAGAGYMNTKDWRDEALEKPFLLEHKEPINWQDPVLALIIGFVVGAAFVWALTPDSVLTDKMIDNLSSKCYFEGDNIPNNGVLLPDGSIKREA